MHLCISKSGHHWSDNGLLPTQHQAIIWTNVGLLKIGPLETIFSEIWMYKQSSYNTINFNMSSVKWRQFCLRLIVYLYLYLYLYLMSCICICICIWSDFCRCICICICIWNSGKNVFVFVFVFDKTYLTPALLDKILTFNWITKYSWSQDTNCMVSIYKDTEPLYCHQYLHIKGERKCLWWVTDSWRKHSGYLPIPGHKSPCTPTPSTVLWIIY